MHKIANYQIQEWLFSTANGHFDIDLAESGIHPHHIDDIQYKAYHFNQSKQSVRNPDRTTGSASTCPLMSCKRDVFIE